MSRGRPRSRVISTDTRHRVPLSLISLALVGLTTLAGCGSAQSAGHASGKRSVTSVTTASSNAVLTADSSGTLTPARQTGVCNPEAVASTTTTGGVSASESEETLPQFFSANSPWNQPVDTLPVDPNSGRLVHLASQPAGGLGQAATTGVTTATGSLNTGLFINTCKWTTPIVTAQNGVSTKVFCRQMHCGPDAVGLSSLTMPSDVNPDPRYDGWFTVLNTGGDVAYDLWRARRQSDGSVSFQYVKKWRLDGAGYQPPYSAGARGSGLPLFAGLITLNDLRSGQINHALAISVPGPAQGTFVLPASSTDGTGDAASLPEGARIRLNPNTGLRNVPPGGNRRLADAIIAALVRYGAIVVDRSMVPTLYAQRDVSANLLPGNELQSLHLSDFEVVQLPARISYPKPGTAPSGPQQFTPPGDALGGGT